MTDVAHKQGFVRNRVIPAIWIVAVSITIIVLPWQLSLIALVGVAVVAGAELWRITQTIQRTVPSVRIPVLAEWMLLAQWPITLSAVRNHAGAGMMALVVFTIFLSDVSAFIGGNKLGLGEHKIAPRISPGKSYEGVALAMVFGLATAFLVRWICQVPIAPLPLAALVLGMIAVGIVGDFNESWVKRQAVPAVKDSSRLLRDHGGMLDRIDSLLVASWLVAIVIRLGWV
jgi:phosphatidate cytidylyltransferase